MEEGICKDSTERRGGSGDMRSGCKVSNWKKNHEKKKTPHTVLRRSALSFVLDWSHRYPLPTRHGC